MSQVQFPIRIIVFDELELIIFVSQGFTPLTASLVISNDHKIFRIVIRLHSQFFNKTSHSKNSNHVKSSWLEGQSLRYIHGRYVEKDSGVLLVIRIVVFLTLSKSIML